MYDLVILNGRIVDGSGNPWYWGDVAIEGGRIAAVGRFSRASARRAIDAAGAVVAPGFIDIHTHTDMTIEAFPLAPSTVMQGVTTAVIGNCGLGLAPVTAETEELLQAYVAPFLRPSDVRFRWRAFGEYLAHLDQLHPSVNLAPLVAHGAVRVAVMGFDARRAQPAQQQAMRELVREAMQAGAFGLSSGLIYAPGTYGDTAELVELAREVGAFGGFYVSHIRGEGDTLVEAVEEALAIGKAAGVRVQLSHHKAMGSRNWGKVHHTLAMLQEARQGGLEAACDVYPYTASSTTITSLLPSWALDGGIPAMLRRLADAETRSRILGELASAKSAEEWRRVQIAHCHSRPDFSGKRITELAQALGCSPAEAVLRAIEASAGGCSIINFAMWEADMEAVLRHPLSMVGSDGQAFAPEAGEYVHPRAYGTFPRALRLARERGLMSLEEAVRKMTSFPAQVLRLGDRGRIAPGMWADLTIFDPEAVRDEATFEQPHQFPRGIHHVLVNGSLTVESGTHTGERAGRVLRRGAGK